jgi:uncharacterized protein
MWPKVEVGCGTQRGRGHPGSEVNVSNVEFVARLYEAFGRGDVPAVLGAMDPQIQWYEAEGHPYTANGEAFTGPDAVLDNVFMKLGADFDGFAIHPKSFHDAGEVVVVEGRSTATHRKTGHRFDAQICHVWALRDGKVATFQQYVDTAQLRDVMGA